jgi:alanine racemase
MGREQRFLTWAEIDRKAIKYNLQALRKLTERNRFVLPNRETLKNIFAQPQYILSVIKANAYGHGVAEVSRLLDQAGVGFFGVSDVSEGIQLRELGITKPVLLFESTLAEFAKDMVHYQLMPAVCSLRLARSLNRYAASMNRKMDIHILVDTGMGRLGIWHEEAFDFIKQIFRMRNLRPMGIFTHFPAADTDKKFTRQQIHDLHALITQLDKAGMIIPYIHAANSMGLAGYKTRILNLARPGLMLYGLYPHDSLRKQIRLKPAMTVKSRIIFLKNVRKGRSISYGRSFFTQRNMKIATLPIGYNDGYLRILSNRAHVLVHGQKCPVIGRVTMDQIMIDVTSVKNVRLNSTVVLLGEQRGDSITADELAHHARTINYEIVCSLGNRLPKLYK